MNQPASNVEKVVIIGSGPAGWTAAIYAARANLSPLVCEGVAKTSPSIQLPGGQLMLTTEVENYPGFPHGVTGPKMMAAFKEQAEHFGTRIEPLDIVECAFNINPAKPPTGGSWWTRTKWQPPAPVHALRTSEDQTIFAHAVIISTGASANWLGLENELRLSMLGGGVSACAVCDGALPIFRGQPLAVVGGGDTAMEEASYLTKFASKVYVIHRRDSFRASKVMQARILESPKAEVVWNSAVTDVMGDDKITGVKLKNLQTNAETVLPVKGLFIAIGHTPNTDFLKGSNVELDEKGYVRLKDGFRTLTNIPGVFAAGDVADQVYRQAVTAAGMGCKAAIDAERWLADQGIH